MRLQRMTYADAVRGDYWKHQCVRLFGYELAEQVSLWFSRYRRPSWKLYYFELTKALQSQNPRFDAWLANEKGRDDIVRLLRTRRGVTMVDLLVNQFHYIGRPPL
jgi:hypothetical protein